jgi:hypothetical protein
MGFPSFSGKLGTVRKWIMPAATAATGAAVIVSTIAVVIVVVVVLLGELLYGPQMPMIGTKNARWIIKAEPVAIRQAVEPRKNRLAVVHNPGKVGQDDPRVLALIDGAVAVFCPPHLARPAEDLAFAVRRLHTQGLCDNPSSLPNAAADFEP